MQEKHDNRANEDLQEDMDSIFGTYTRIVRGPETGFLGPHILRQAEGTLTPEEFALRFVRRIQRTNSPLKPTLEQMRTNIREVLSTYLSDNSDQHLTVVSLRSFLLTGKEDYPNLPPSWLVTIRENLAELQINHLIDAATALYLLDGIDTDELGDEQADLVLRAIRLGCEYARMQMRLAEPEAMRGQTVRTAADKGRQTQVAERKSQYQRWQRRIDELRGTPGPNTSRAKKSHDDACASVAMEDNVAKSTVKSHVVNRWSKTKKVD